MNSGTIKNFLISYDILCQDEKRERLHLDLSNLMKALKMTTLSPTIQRMIMSGDIPNTMTLTKFYSEFPEDWEEQEHHFGMK